MDTKKMDTKICSFCKGPPEPGKLLGLDGVCEWCLVKFGYRYVRGYQRFVRRQMEVSRA